MQGAESLDLSTGVDSESANDAISACKALQFDASTDISKIEPIWDIALNLDGELTKLYNYLSSLCEPVLPGLKSLRLSRSELSAVAKHLSSVNPSNEDLGPLSKAQVGLLRILKSQQTGETASEETRLEISRISQLLERSQSEFSTLRHKLSLVVPRYAPNLCQVVEQSTALDLLVHYGGLKRLSCASASNMHTVGAITTSGSAKEINCSLSRDELLAGISRQNRLKCVRALAGKAVLAARVDMAQTSPDGSKGAEWRAGVQQRLLAIEKAPESIIQRALPVPKDPVRNKRGGRRINRAAKLLAAQQRQRNKTVEFAKFR